MHFVCDLSGQGFLLQGLYGVDSQCGQVVSLLPKAACNSYVSHKMATVTSIALNLVLPM